MATAVVKGADRRRRRWRRGGGVMVVVSMRGEKGVAVWGWG